MTWAHSKREMVKDIVAYGDQKKIKGGRQYKQNERMMRWYGLILRNKEDLIKDIME